MPPSAPISQERLTPPSCAYNRPERLQKMQPISRGIFEARVTRAYRMTFQVEGADLILRRVGTHDILRTP